jgi:putative ABC transport system permease protein
MVLFENLRLALAALHSNKLRSFLTMLGIIIGVGAVVAVVSLVQGLQYKVSKELQGVGATYIAVDPKLQRTQLPDAAAREVKLTWEDGQAIQKTVPGVDLITPAVIGVVPVKYRDRQYQPTAVCGVNEDWQDVTNFGVELGRFVSRVDLENRRPVVVVGKKLIKELDLGPNPIGREMYVGKYPATVIGVMEGKGQGLGIDYDDLAFVPFDTAITIFGRNSKDRVRLRLRAHDTAMVDQVKDGIVSLLRTRHKIGANQEDDFQVQTQDEILKSAGNILDSVTKAVAGVVSIALLVGGIGIMNIMLVSVTERTREIGLRKAVGARRQDVLVQFLIEALTLSLIGGAIGIGIGYLLGVVVAGLLPSWPSAHVPAWAALLAFGFAAFVGIFFGSYPAAKASRLDPIEALRFE